MNDSAEQNGPWSGKAIGVAVACGTGGCLTGDNRFHHGGFVPFHLNPGEITINLSHYLYLALALPLVTKVPIVFASFKF